MEAVEVKSILNRVPELLDASYPWIWAVHDNEADVLYLNSKKPSHADDPELTDNDLIIRYEKGPVVGITVLNASRRGTDMGAVCDGGCAALEITPYVSWTAIRMVEE